MGVPREKPTSGKCQVITQETLKVAFTEIYTTEKSGPAPTEKQRCCSLESQKKGGKATQKEIWLVSSQRLELDFAQRSGDAGAYRRGHTASWASNARAVLGVNFDHKTAPHGYSFCQGGREDTLTSGKLAWQKRGNRTAGPQASDWEEVGSLSRTGAARHRKKGEQLNASRIHGCTPHTRNSLAPGMLLKGRPGSHSGGRAGRGRSLHHTNKRGTSNWGNRVPVSSMCDI